MKKILIGVGIGIALSIGGVAFAAPPSAYQVNVLPYQNNKYDLGTTTPANQWLHVYTQQLCLSGDCKSSWSAAGALFPFTPQTLGNATGTLLLLNGGIISAASSTIGNGLQNGGLTVSGGATTTGNTFNGTGTPLFTTGPNSSYSNGWQITPQLTGIPAFIVTSVGNVGVGDVAPTNLFSIIDNGSFSAQPTHTVFSVASTTGLGTGTTTNLVITSQGNLGIGTTSPTNLLTIGNVDLGTQPGYGGETIGAINFNPMLSLGQSNTRQLQILWSNNVTAASASASIDTYGYSNPISIDGSLLTLQGNSGGDVAVGGTSVHNVVNGVTSTSTILEIKKTGVGTIGPVLQLNNDGDSALGDKYLISMIDGASSGGLYRGAILGTLNTTGQLQMDFMTGTAGSTTPLGLTKMLSILPNGRVGVGSTTPFSKFAIHASNGDTNTTLFAIGSSTVSATTTLFSIDNQGNITTAMTGTQCVHEVNGLLSGTGSDCGSGGGTFSFTPTSYSGTAVNATSTALWLKGTAPFSLIASSTFATNASTTNLEMTYYVQEFPGANLGAQFNAAYAIAPSGSTFMIVASTTFSTAMNMGTSGKVGTIKCSPGVVLTWTGAATSTILNATDLNNHRSGWGLQNCTIHGTGGAAQVLVQLGGSNGGQGAVLSGNDLESAYRGLQTEQNTWNINVENNWFAANDRAVWVESANNSGEGFRFRGNTYADCNNTYGDCFFSDTNGSDGLSFDHDVWDDAGVHLKDGNLNATFTAPKFENPNASVIGRYTYMTFDSGGFMNVTIQGGDFMNGADSLAHSPNQFILNGAQLSDFGTTFDNNTGGAISVPAIANNYGGGTFSYYEGRDVNSGTATFSNIATSSLVVKFDSFNNAFSVTGSFSATSLVDTGTLNCSGSSALTTDGSGNIACGALSGFAKFTYPFPNQLGGGNATSSLTGFSGGIFVTASSTFMATTTISNGKGTLSNQPTELTVTGPALFGVGGYTWTPSVYSNFFVQDGQSPDVFGADVNAYTLTTNTRKFTRIGSPPYALASTLPTAILIADDNGSTNLLDLGGGTSGMNAANIIKFFTTPVSASTGTTTTTGTEAMRIDSTGFVGIGSTTPFGNLSVSGATTGVPGVYVSAVAAQNAEIWLTQQGQSVLKLKAQDNQERITYNKPLLFDSDDAGTLTMALTSTNRVGIGTSTPSFILGVGSTAISGTVAQFENSTGSCFVNPNSAFTGCTSDARLKTDITPLPSELNSVLALNPVSYKWISDGATTTTHYGFIAQDVEKIFPDLVMTGPDGYKALNYAGFAPYIVKALQEQQKQIDSIEGVAAPLIVEGKRSVEENWQDALIALLIIGFGVQQWQIRRLKKVI